MFVARLAHRRADSLLNTRKNLAITYKARRKIYITLNPKPLNPKPLTNSYGKAEKAADKKREVGGFLETLSSCSFPENPIHLS